MSVCFALSRIPAERNPSLLNNLCLVIGGQAFMGDFFLGINLGFNGQETARLVREMDWSAHPLGEPSHWPLSLKITLGILFHTRQPMFLFWGSDHFCFYNDGYIPILGGHKHPWALGRKGEDVWAEIWPLTQEQILIAESGRSTWNVDQMLPVLKEGRETESYFTYGYSPVFSEDGKIEGTLVSASESTAQIFAQREAEAARLELKDFFMQAPIPMVVLHGSEHLYTFANPPYIDFVGREVVGRRIVDVFNDGQVDDFIRSLDRVYQTGEPYVGKELPIHIADRSGIVKERFINVVYNPFRTQNGSIKGIVAFHQDVTEQVLIRNEMAESKRLAEEANMAKSRFLANMSHEIRTPLGVMMGFADLAMDQPDLTDDVKNYLNAIRRNGILLTRLIGEVLDLAKIEASRIEIETVRFDLNSLLEEVVSFLNVQADEKGIVLHLEGNESLPQFVKTDPTRLRQILVNLIGNAIKFTERGSVKVQTGLNDKKLKFTIEDTGIGLSPIQVDKLFKPFSQADCSMTRKFGGTGLGLTLARQLARAMGGEVSLQSSALGVGSVFLCEVTVEEIEGRIVENTDLPVRILSDIHPKRNELDGLNVLLVEDSLDNQVLFSRYLKSAGARVDLADNGEEGVLKALQNNYDLVLMDIQMPLKNGHDATQELREKNYQKPIVALTAHALKEDRERAVTGGFSDYLTKPLNRKTLVDTIQHLTGGAELGL